MTAIDCVLCLRGFIQINTVTITIVIIKYNKLHCRVGICTIICIHTEYNIKM